MNGPNGAEWSAAPETDPLEREFGLEPAAALDSDAPMPPPPSTMLERLIEERVQLTADLCSILCRQVEVESAIRRALYRCSSSSETRAELVRQCFARARRRLRG